jgi:glucosamine--fructose-6-phosphate aminotransferase (isomerizing)
MPDFTARLASLVAEPSRDDGHDPARHARVERTRTEMMVQGAAIRATLEAEAAAIADLAGRLADRPLNRVVVTGCGDSWFVGHAVRHAVESLTGLPVEAAQALDYAAYGAAVADPGTLIVGLSAGGNTPAVMEALGQASARGAVAVGVSNTPGSPITAAFDASLLVHATRKGWPTQSSTAACALLVRFAAALGERRGRDTGPLLAELERVPDLMDALAGELDGTMAATAERLAPARIALFAGLGPNFGAAAFGAAKVKELSPIHAIAAPLEEMHHYRIPKAGDPVIIVATDPAARERALDTALVARHVGARAVAVLSGPDPDIEAHADHVVRVPAVAPALAAFVSSVPLHLLAYHFAKARFARGLGYEGGGA